MMVLSSLFDTGEKTASSNQKMGLAAYFASRKHFAEQCSRDFRSPHPHRDLIFRPDIERTLIVAEKVVARLEKKYSTDDKNKNKNK